MSHSFLYVLGGRARGHTITAAERLNLTTLQWEPIHGLSEPRGNHSAVLWEEDGETLVVVTGGNGIETNLDTCEGFKASTDSWVPFPPLSVPRHALTATHCTDGAVYVSGGWEYGTKCTQLLERLEVTADGKAWVTVSRLPTPRRLHGFTQCKGDLLLFGGGSDKKWFVGSAEAYNVADDKWRSLAPMPQAGCACAVTVEDRVFVLIWGQEQFYEYLVSSDQYIAVGALPLASWHGFSACASGSRLYVLGGKTAGKWSNNTYCYDIHTDQWEDLPRMTFCRRRFASIVSAHQVSGSAIDERPPSSFAGSVSKSAFTVAIYRAEEATRSSPMFIDAFAAYLRKHYVEQLQEEALLKHPFYNVGMQLHAIRTKMIDDCVRLWMGVTNADEERSYMRLPVETGICQIVLMAAGMDSRSVRLQSCAPPGCVFFEVDKQDVLAFKKANIERFISEQGCLATPTRYIGEDVTDFDALSKGLQDCGFDSEQPAVWVLEGLLEYLSPEETRLVGEHVCNLSADGSRVVAPILSPELADYFTTKTGVCYLPWHTPLAPPEDVSAALSSHPSVDAFQLARSADFGPYFETQMKALGDVDPLSFCTFCVSKTAIEDK